MNTNNGWKLVSAAATPEMVKAGLFWLAHFQLMRIADKRNALASAFEAMLAAAPEAPPLTVTVDPDPRGVSVGVYLGSSCVYHGAHEVPAPAAGDARDAINLPIAAARMIRREYLPSNPRRMSHVAVRDAVERFLCALQAAEAAIAAAQQGGE